MSRNYSRNQSINSEFDSFVVMESEINHEDYDETFVETPFLQTIFKDHHGFKCNERRGITQCCKMVNLQHFKKCTFAI